MANATNDNIRFFLEPTATNAPYIPNTDIQGAYWGSGNDGMQVGKVSAVAYSMAVKLQEELNIPIGIINSAVGSSVIEAWLPSQDIDNTPDLANAMKRLGLYFDEEFYPNGTNQMSSYYNLKIHPLIGYNIAGVIWYQGESNSPRPQLYAQELDLYKKSYSRIFNFPNNEMPFIYCQVATWIEKLENPQNLAPLAEAFYDGWAMYPETMAMLPIYDTDMTYVGNVVIHPTNKTPIGKRFATAALNMVYGGEGEYTAAVYDAMTVKGDSIIISFTHVGEGLKSINGIDNIRGFAICGADNIFVGAEARIISDNEVIVWNDRVKAPTQVTYAWASYNTTSNLANSVDIPAAPFRTDRSEGYKFYNPQDWSFADGEYWGVDGEVAAFLPAWFNAPISGDVDATLTYDTENKSEGKASLKAVYGAAGVVGVGPKISYRTTVNQMANFNTISVDVMNPDESDKSIELWIKGFDQKIYKATALGTEGKTAATVGKTAGFETLAFDIKTLKDDQGVVLPTNTATTILATATNIQFSVTTAAAGTFYIDNVMYGLSTDVALSVEEETIGESQMEVRLQNNTLNVTTGTDNPIRKIELIDMSGRTVYMNNNINNAEYSFEIASGKGLYIAKIQSDKLTASEKVLIY
jgi:sialate O-acetylesterase